MFVPLVMAAQTISSRHSKHLSWMVMHGGAGIRHKSWAARYNAWFLIKLMSKGLVFSFSFSGTKVLMVMHDGAGVWA